MVQETTAEIVLFGEEPAAPAEFQTPHKIEIYKKFIEFESLPDPDRAAFLEIPKDPKTERYVKIPTLGDFAKKYGIHRNTLSNWKARPEFGKLVEQKQKVWGIDLVPNVLAALYRRCVRYGISSDVELFLAYYKNWDRKQVIEIKREKFDMNDIRALIAPLPREMQEKFYATITDIIRQAELLRGSGEVQVHSTGGPEDNQG